MLSLEEQANQQWIMDNMKLLLANAGIVPDTTLIDEAKQKQEEHDQRIALIETVIEAQQAVADKHNPTLKNIRAEMAVFDVDAEKAHNEYLTALHNRDKKEASKCLARCQDCKNKSAEKLEEVKELIELMTVEAQQAEDAILASNQ